MSSTNNSNNNNNNNNASKKKKPALLGVDTLLTTHGKTLAAGQGLSLRLVKGPGPVVNNPDPVDAKAPVESFPILAKFPESSVVRPDFTNTTYRLYQQDVPKAVDDSSDSDNDNNNNQAADGGGGGQPKKRWKSRRGKDVPQRQWILQQEVEFLETMLARRREKPRGGGGQQQQQEEDATTTTSGTTRQNSNNKRLSSRYEGTPENNTSQYIVLRVPPPPPPPTTSNNNNNNNNNNNTTDGRCLQVCLVPANAMVAFSQPDARKTFSLSQAERVMEDQRHSVQTLHHLHHDTMTGASTSSTNNTATTTTSATTTTTTTTPLDDEPMALQQYLGRKRGAAAQQQQQQYKPKDSKARLLRKFSKLEAAAQQQQQHPLDDGDDVMADVAYRNRKGAGAARKELLETVAGDGIIKVSEEGVLGGANDAEFGGRQRFGQFKADQSNSSNNNNNKTAGKGESQSTQERGADGAAMADDFYQRDVQAEYEEMDFDANELFDDDDVDVGESEVQEENAGFGGPDDDDDNEEDSESEGQEEEISGAEGLASVAGFKALLAKARGEGPAPGSEDTTEANGGAAAGKVDTQGKDSKNRKRKAENDHVSKFLAATGKEKPTKGSDSRKRIKTNEAAETQPMAIDQTAPAPAPSAPPPIDPSVDGFQLGPDGLRVLTLAAVRCELWLNGSSMPTKRLMKVFDIKKKSPIERKQKFLEIVNELCTDQMDPVHGKMKVLKQHWSHMG